MVFSSLLFLIVFLPITLLLYFICPNKIKNALLLIVSLIFYAWDNPKHIVLMIITSFYIWLFALIIDRLRQNGNMHGAKMMLVLSLVLSLSTLGFFKYFGFIVENVPFLNRTFLADIRLVLPIGISFYTFQALSYAIDVYRGTVKVQKSWLNFSMYISFFPQLIAGPIVQYADIEGQIECRTITAEKFCVGIRRFCIGLGKKVLLANQVGMVWSAISSAESFSCAGAWVGVISFTFQIYFDFSAYSDMAIGLGKMFGFEFTENFNYPYQSKSVSEFWRRWHITLGTWFREHVYIPLGGNRKGKRRLVFNLFVVWSLTGLWHGADWQFILWGIYYFAILCLEKFVFGKFLDKIPVVFQCCYTMLMVVIGWVLFASADVGQAAEIYRAMLCMDVAVITSKDIFLLSNNGLLLVICAVCATDIPKRCMLYLQRNGKGRAYDYLYNVSSLCIMWISVAFLMCDGYNPFLYFRF